MGLTGSVASGKSTVADAWKRAGVPVVSADALAREVVKPGTPGLKEVVEAFGPEVRREDGTLDRGAVRERVFRSEEDRRRLEGILHPRIAERRSAWLAERRSEGAELAVSEIPLLYEAGLAGDFDVTVVVHAPRAERLRRLIEDRGLDAEEAGRIMAAQMDPQEKRRRADHVVVNDGTLDDLRREALELLDHLKERAAAAAGRA